jgi:hypothetical protein
LPTIEGNIKAADAAERLAEEAQKQLVAEFEPLKASSEEVKTKETEQERAIAALKASTGALDSRIVSSFPPLFNEFRLQIEIDDLLYNFIVSCICSDSHYSDFRNLFDSNFFEFLHFKTLFQVI